MNEKIEELVKQCTTQLIDYDVGAKYDQVDHIKLAELIVKECVHTALKDALPDWGNEASSANTQCVKIAAEIKQHFGVE